MEEAKQYAILLTEGQSIVFMRCDPALEVFDIARREIGCDWIEIIAHNALDDQRLVLLVDEEAKLKGGNAINCVASYLYGAHQHGDPIVGHALMVRAADDHLELLTADQASSLMFTLTAMRDKSIEAMRKAFRIVN